MTASTKYIEGIGRRKTSTARVRITPGSKMNFTVNKIPLHEYFGTEDLQLRAKAPFSKIKAGTSFDVSIVVKGGGKSSQAGAISLGIARALSEYDKNLRKPLKDDKLLSRDSRMKERRKFGLKKARKAPQWSKR